MNPQKKTELRQKIDAGVKAAIAAALEEHRRAGRPVAVIRGGRVVIALPETRYSDDSMALREMSGELSVANLQI